MASKGIYTFATLSDFCGLRELEDRQQVFYLVDETSDARDRVLYRSYEEVPGLGQAPVGSWISERRFRVLISTDDLDIRQFELDDGGTRFTLGRRTIDRSLIWRPGGVMESERVVIQGSIETISEDPDIIDFYRGFSKYATRRFYGQDWARIGPAAVGLYLSGYSLKGFASEPKGVQLVEKTLAKYRRDRERIRTGNRE